jgi:hypothetical protein
VVIKNTGNPRPTFEDLLRGVAYLSLTLWGVLFLIYPPVAYVDSLDILTRLSWMGVGILGSTMAALGAFTRIDIKLELPGLLLTLIAPVFYWAAQVYFILHPTEGAPATSRVALAAYAIIPFFLMLPRVYALYAESQRLKRINSASAKAWVLAHPGEPEPDLRRLSVRVSKKGS